MPYADADDKRKSQRDWFRGKYESDPKFQRSEKKRAKQNREGRSAKETAANREYMKEYMRQYRAAKKAAKEAASKKSSR